MAISNGGIHRDSGRRREVITRSLDKPAPERRDANDIHDPKISELHAHLKSDHSRRAITAQTDPEQACRRRSGVGDRSEPRLGRGFSRNAGQHHAGKRKIRMVEYIEELRVEPQFHTFRHGKPL
jgi:hypothetical protein